MGSEKVLVLLVETSEWPPVAEIFSSKNLAVVSAANYLRSEVEAMSSKDAKPFEELFKKNDLEGAVSLWNDYAEEHELGGYVYIDHRPVRRFLGKRWGGG